VNTQTQSDACIARKEQELLSYGGSPNNAYNSERNGLSHENLMWWDKMDFSVELQFIGIIYAEINISLKHEKGRYSVFRWQYSDVILVENILIPQKVFFCKKGERNK
jgi:hypothetical protein